MHCGKALNRTNNGIESECGAEIYEGDDFTLEGFYQGEKITVCEICKDEIISEHPEGWTEFNPHYFIYKKDESLFEIMSKMFKPEGAL